MWNVSLKQVNKVTDMGPLIQLWPQMCALNRCLSSYEERVNTIKVITVQYCFIKIFNYKKIEWQGKYFVCVFF